MYSSAIIEFSKATQNTTLYVGLSVLLIIIFMMTPLHSFIGKIVILILLMYTLYYNIKQTNKIVNHFNIDFFNISTWNHINTNLLFNYIFSISLLVLIISIISKIF